MNRHDIRETRPDPRGPGRVRATPADTQRLAGALSGQLPIAVYSSGRVIGAMTVARQQGAKILAEIEIRPSSRLNKLHLVMPDPKGGERHESPHACVGGCAV